jgi:nicotinamidase-related amidase
MLPGSTLFFDACTQRDFWPGGAWPLVDQETARNVATLFALAASLGIRQGGVCCAHPPDLATPSGDPRHCVVGADGTARAPGCAPARPMAITVPAERAVLALDRTHAYYVTTGCLRAADAEPGDRIVIDHLTAGVRDAVVFGAGVETALDHVVDALLRRRVRTHVVLDAVGALDPARAQQVIESWKRRGVDGLTTATVARLLGDTSGGSATN